MEERKVQREIVNRYLKVFDENDNRFIGYLVDITPMGAMLQSNDPIEPNTPYRLRVELPEKIDGRRHITVEARSVWDKKETNALFYHTGFEFESSDKAEEVRIRHLMDAYSLDKH
ncbi:hypothetical protein CAI21_15550 [Alkalilimnicola ehrlichii]|uniref:PilZ domain-containing protein n=1 Tax=Alkalilimnicola ehrlichii TaxID=351052 RepID=A0A3E0WQ04_9GAMM|nr:PilZ domain-containing protein [Alkalilimnicola ehrlichii]RFA26978.1 hypothetical protein CAI21_15550 [Alkalilimnicola ehrlichii]RFA34097.1 hypothetical protein CAL65_15685 [Alkalilimnicola ehrlichii]